MYYHWLNMLFQISLDLEGSINSFNTETIEQQYHACHIEKKKALYRAMMKQYHYFILKFKEVC